MDLPNAQRILRFCGPRHCRATAGGARSRKAAQSRYSGPRKNWPAAHSCGGGTLPSWTARNHHRFFQSAERGRAARLFFRGRLLV